MKSEERNFISKEITMYGFSIFMNADLDNQVRSYIKQMASQGFSGIFTSMHIPEDDVSLYKARLETLGKLAQENGLELMIDISGDALNKSGFSFDKLAELTTMGVTGLRMDDHISHETIAKVSQQMVVSLNASTITQADIAELKAHHANFNQLEAWHNYYPRPETGLSRELFLSKHHFLKTNGFTVMAFVPGDDLLRQPLYETLPTLEDHRQMHPLAALLDMKQMEVDHIYIGDGGLKPYTSLQCQRYINENTIILRAQAETADFKYVEGEHENRQDSARDVIRSAHARFNPIPTIAPENTVARSVGAITIDNSDYGRYMGEIQIVKRALVADTKVNKVGYVIDDDIDLITHIGAGQKFIIEKETKQ